VTHRYVSLTALGLTHLLRPCRARANPSQPVDEKPGRQTTYTLPSFEQMLVLSKPVIILHCSKTILFFFVFFDSSYGKFPESEHNESSCDHEQFFFLSIDQNLTHATP